MMRRSRASWRCCDDHSIPFRSSPIHRPFIKLPVVSCMHSDTDGLGMVCSQVRRSVSHVVVLACFTRGFLPEEQIAGASLDVGKYRYS